MVWRSASWFSLNLVVLRRLISLGMEEEDDLRLQAVELLEPSLGWRLEPCVRVPPDAPLQMAVLERETDATWYSDYYVGFEHLEFLGSSPTDGPISLSVIHGMHPLHTSTTPPPTHPHIHIHKQTTNTRETKRGNGYFSTPHHRVTD